MKRKILAMICMVFISISLSGCNIKFIEKVEDSSKQSTEEQFGDIKIDDSSSSLISDSGTDSEENTKKESESESESESNEQAEEDGTFVYADITFKSDDSKTTYWIKEDCPAKVSPSMTAKDYTLLYRGDFVTLTALSTDNKWAMVSIYGGPSSFVKFENLSLEEIEVSQTVKPIETQQPQESDVPDSSSESSSSQEPSSSEASSIESSSSQQPSESTVEPPQSSSEQVSSEPPQQSSTQPPVDQDTYDGIGFPSNASSTSFNMGVEFADVTITLTIRKDNAIISNGPDKPANSTGYYALGTLNKGETIKCTGIGRNGYVRVEYGGNIGFIDSKYTEY